MREGTPETPLIPPHSPGGNGWPSSFLSFLSALSTPPLVAPRPGAARRARAPRVAVGSNKTALLSWLSFRPVSPGGDTLPISSVLLGGMELSPPVFLAFSEFAPVGWPLCARWRRPGSRSGWGRGACGWGTVGIPSRRTLVEIVTPVKDIEVHVGVVPAWCYRVSWRLFRTCAGNLGGRFT